MRKITYLLTLLLAFVSWNSLNAQTGSSTGWYAPGERLDVTQLTAGTDVFIYSMCRVNGTDSDFSRFIINSGNAASTLAGKPAIFMTSNVDHIWKVRSAQEVTRTENVDDGNGGTTSVTYTGTQITFSRKKGSEEPTYYYCGINGATNATAAGNDQTFVLTQWTKAPYVSGATKSGTDVWLEDVQGNAVQQSTLTESDKVYLMSALSGKSINTNDGNFQTDKANGYPVALYAVNKLSVSEFGLQVSTAPTATSWAENTKWYKMKMNSSSWRYVESGNSYTDTAGKLTLTQTTSSNLMTGAWAVVGNTTDGYQFYNMGEGPSKVLGITGSEGNARMAMVDAASPGNGVTTAFDITYHTDGNWYIKKHGNNNDYINNRDWYVAHWGTSDALGNSGSTFVFERIDDVSAYAATAKTKFLDRVGMWKKVPELWAGATEVYNTLNAVTLSATVTNGELVTLANAQKTAATAFVSAVNNQRVTFSNCATTPAARVNSYLYFDSGSNTLKGRDATSTNTNHTLNEVFTLKPGTDFTVKLYSANAAKYIGKPTGSNSGSTSGVADINAAAFDIYTADSYANNSVVFCVDGTATMHLLGGLNVSGYNSKTDPGSRWLISTDLSRHELQTAINTATTWKSNLETLVNNLVTAQKISVKPTTLSVTMPTAIDKAQNAFDDPNGTQATRTAAATVLNAALTKAQGAWLGELGTAQEFKLKSNTITDYYLTTNQAVAYNGEGVLRLMTAPDAEAEDYTTVLANQTFTLVPGTGENAGKYIIQSNGKQITTGTVYGWNAAMSDAGSPYAFEFTDLANALVRVKTANGYVGPNAGVTTANVETPNDQKNGHKTNSFVYINHGTDNPNIVWTLEFIAPTPGSVDKTTLRSTYNKYDALNWLSTYDSNIINKNAPSIVNYNQKKLAAQQILANEESTLTQIDVNTAEAELKAAYSNMLNNFFGEADARQGYRIKFKSAAGYYMTLNPGIEQNNVVTEMTVAAKNPATKQIMKIVPATGSDAGKFYLQEGTTGKKVNTGKHYWNPALQDNGMAFEIEVAEFDGTDQLVVSFKNNPGSQTGVYLGPVDNNPAANAYVYMDQANKKYWIIEPYVSPDYIADLKANIEKVETYIGSNVGQYTTTYDMSFNNTSIEMVNGTGDYATEDLTNETITNQSALYNDAFANFTINQPKVGKLYRFKGKVSGKYMCPTAATPSDDTKMAMNADADQPGTIFILQAGDVIDGQQGYKLLNYSTGYYTKNTHNNGALASAANSIKITASETAANLGYYTLKSNRAGNTAGNSIGTYLYDNNTVVDRNGSYAANNCDWQIEEVTWLPISVTTTYSKLGTFVSPVSLTRDASRLKFYTGAIRGTYLTLTEFTGDVIPANVPFLIEYQDGSQQSNGCSFLQINGGEASLGQGVTNVLEGGLETVATPTITGKTIYTLQKTTNNTQEFWQYTGTTVKGCRAYLPVPNDVAGALSMIFEGGTTTAIEEAQAAEGEKVIYDLSGRRVQKASKGLYIVNGKKVYVK